MTAFLQSQITYLEQKPLLESKPALTSNSETNVNKPNNRIMDEQRPTFD